MGHLHYQIEQNTDGLFCATMSHDHQLYDMILCVITICLETLMLSLPSVPTTNVEREEEELELPGVPDHQPQVDLKYWKSY